MGGGEGKGRRDQRENEEEKFEGEMKEEWDVFVQIRMS